MGEQWGFYFDPDSCMGCNACAIACKNRHDTDAGHVDWRRVETVSEGEFPDYEETNVSLSCMHCEDAPCEEVCPTGAIEKRESDGIVTIDREKCIGCGYCGWACPYGAPQYGDDGLMQKCNLCLDKGPGSGADAPSKNEQQADGEALEPACVDECVGDALDAGPVGELLDKASQEAAERFEQNRTNVIIDSTGENSVTGMQGVRQATEDS
ncbi:4Fe-4S dicluster domain-containing protein [Halapricum desulfuricans]|uniref:Fe-S-cluster-containing dehydrogenase component n=1 Tax=Halapricum desulfuricans TaxID=2841257 RepID=A0A897N1E8_9EURY|nr:4Fe-4S dicluster domain-containing protein [Halapricum desulfuricans]QSG04939.1 Fe-S-cluster-containing dehydrogenase component [Halapricum desulfuricans]